MADVIQTTPGRTGDGLGGAPEPGLGDLVRSLAQDSATLVRQEMALAKAELRQNVKSVARDIIMIAVGGFVALVGVLVLIAALVVAVGDALDQYWLGALIVGVLFLAVGGLLAKKFAGNLGKEEMAPTRTIETLKEDKQWLQSEMKQARRELA